MELWMWTQIQIWMVPQMASHHIFNFIIWLGISPILYTQICLILFSVLVDYCTLGIYHKTLEAFNQSPVGIFQLHTSNCLWVQAMPGFPGSSVIKNPPVKQETQVQSLGWKDPLEREMAPHSSILAWRIPWTEEPGGLQSGGHKESSMIEQLNNDISSAQLYAHLQVSL